MLGYIGVCDLFGPGMIQINTYNNHKLTGRSKIKTNISLTLNMTLEIIRIIINTK